MNWKLIFMIHILNIFLILLFFLSILKSSHDFMSHLGKIFSRDLFMPFLLIYLRLNKFCVSNLILYTLMAKLLNYDKFCVSWKVVDWMTSLWDIKEVWIVKILMGVEFSHFKLIGFKGHLVKWIDYWQLNWKLKDPKFKS